MQSTKTRLALALLLGTLYALLLWVFPVDIALESSKFGYTPDPVGAAKFLETLEAPFFSQAAPDAMAAEPKERFLFRAMDKAHRERYGEPFAPKKQGIGDCTSWAGMHAVYCAECIAWELGQRDEVPTMPASESFYGGARVEARGKPGDGANPVGGWGDGATGYSIAKWLKEYGVIYRRQYDNGIDLTVYSADRAKRWGAYGNGGEGDKGRLDREAKLKPCHYVANVKTWPELIAAINSGYPVTIASGQGFNRTRDAQGFCRPSGTWRHMMVLIATRFDRPGALVLNSWGDYCSGPKYPDDMPPGSFWADQDVIERILAQGDSWAISGTAFTYRNLDHNWLEIE